MSSQKLSRSVQVPLVAGVACALAVVAATAVGGALVGERLPFGEKAAAAHEGVAVLQDRDSGFASLVLDEDDVRGFDARSLYWVAGSASGHGRPPCLREPGKEVQVEAGVMRISNPDGGWHQQVVWLRCP